MKPRQTVKNYHNPNVAPYQQQQQQNSSASAALRDVDLAKIGINLDDMPNLQALAAAINPNLSSQEDIVNCLQAIYGGKNSGDILSTKILPTLNDWPTQSVSPPDYSRIGVGNGSTSGSSAGISAGSSLIMGASGIGFNSNNNSASSGQQQDIQQFSNSHHRHSHHHQTPSSSSALNHFRISSMHSPQQQQQLSQQQKSVLSIHQHHQNDLSNRRLNHNMSTSSASSSSFANVATAAAVNASSSNATASTSSNSNSSSLDTNHLSALAGNINASGKNSNSSHVSNIMDTLGSMDGIFYQDATSSSSSSSIQANNNNTSSLSSNNQQQSLIKHQQLQKLLKATNSQLKSPSSSATTLSHTRNDTQPQRNITSNNHNNMSQAAQHPISSSPASTISPPQAAFASVPKSLLNLAACSSSFNSTSASSLPSATSKFSSMVSQLNLRSARNACSGASGNQSNLNTSSGGGGGNSINSGRSINRASHSSSGGNTSTNSSSYNDAFSQWTLNGMNDSNNTNSNIIAAHNTRPPTITNNAAAPSTRSGLKQQLQLSLLSDDQSTSNSSRASSSLRVAQCNFNSGSAATNTKQTSVITQQQIHQKLASSKEAFLASLQERAARAGLSIGEINKPVQMTTPSTNLSLINNNNNLATTSTNAIINNSIIATPDNLISTQQQQNISPTNQSSTKDDFMNNSVDRKEIESALNRVGARNDLSLLYPPMLLASNSQKQINALSAGLQEAEDSELFTNEVKRIVLEECNIIYECKECNNLFRSLANLVKHKRTYCLEANSEKNGIELNRRHYMNMPTDQPAINNSNPLESDEVTDQDQAKVLDDNLNSRSTGGQESSLLATATNFINPSTRPGPATSDRRPNLANDLKAIRALQKEKRNQQAREIMASRLRDNHQTHSDTLTTTTTTTQTSLSKLLQSQPKNRLPVTRDSALMGALNMTTHVSLLNTNGLPATNDPLSAFEIDKGINYSSNEIMNEQLVRNSTLAKSLLDEKVRNISTNPRQTSIDLSKAEPIQSCPTPTPKRLAPKRKFLEYCIQKVKRDKLLTEEEEDEERSQVQMISKGSSLLQADAGDQWDGLGEVSKQESTGNDSDIDSDILTIDLDEPKKMIPGRKSRRQLSNAASSSSSTSSSAKLSSSSALLKALTRPVDPKRLFNNQTQLSNEEKSIDEPIQGQSKHEQHQTEEQQEPEQLQPDTVMDEPAELEKTNDEGVPEEVELPQVPAEASAPESVEPSSPLFDKYTCDICDDDHIDLASLMKHTFDGHKEERMVYPCIFCSFSFIAMENVCRHIIDIHKKPRAQVHRLKEVVRSRSYMSSDFSACSDTGLMEALAKRTGDKKMTTESWSPSSSGSSSTSSSNSSSSTSSSGSSNSSSGSSSSSSSPAHSSQPTKSQSHQPVSSGESAGSSPSGWQEGASPSKQPGDEVSGSSGSDDEDSSSSSSSSDSNSSSSSSSSEPEEAKSSKEAPDYDSTKAISHTALKDQSTQKSQDQLDKKLPSSASNESDDSEVYPDSEYDSNALSDELTDKTSEQQIKTKQLSSSSGCSNSQHQQQRLSSNKSTSESTPSSSSSAATSGSGGIIKLKIQLKTRPDEKSKVYEIV